MQLINKFISWNDEGGRWQDMSDTLLLDSVIGQGRGERRGR